VSTATSIAGAFAGKPFEPPGLRIVDPEASITIATAHIQDLPMLRRAALVLSGLLATPLLYAQEVPEPAQFIRELAAETGWQESDIRATLDGARKMQSILDAISRPAEAKPWKDYRPIFLTDARIDAGAAFMREHVDLLNRVEAETGVPASVIAAIIGVETSYGKITGSYRVLDALYTLGFHYPPRAAFFRDELKHLFRLAGEEQLEIGALKGSYAGAMGWGQFIPSSYRNFAVDGDGDGRRDLWNSLPDIVASVANYFVEHGWAHEGVVAERATAAAGARPFERDGLNMTSTVGELAELGYTVEAALDPAQPATLLKLEGSAGDEYWLVFPNFYVISRYNRSPLYSMAVHQLSLELEKARQRGLIRRQ
jgi:membrane-bound lytic murein transglycosylase B